MTVKMTSEEAIRNEINTRRQQIADGVNMATKERMEEEIKGYEEELAKILADERASEQEQKIAEVDNMELPFDFDAELDTLGVNVTVRQMLKDERAKNFADFNVEYERINREADQKLAGAAERELQLQRQNGELQKEIEQRIERHNELADANAEQHSYIKKLENDLFETKARMEEVEQNRKNAAEQLEEAQTDNEQLRSELDELRKQAVGERQAQRVIDVTETAQSLFEQAKQATAEKRKVMVTAELGLYREVKGEDGKKEIVHYSKLAEMEQVLSLPEAPALLLIEEDPNAGNDFRPEEVPSGLGDFEGRTDQGVQASETVTLESLKAEVDAIKSHLGLVA